LDGKYSYYSQLIVQFISQLQSSSYTISQEKAGYQRQWSDLKFCQCISIILSCVCIHSFL